MQEQMETLEKARNAINSLKKADITELKSLCSPPRSVADIFVAVLILLGKKDTSW